MQVPILGRHNHYVYGYPWRWAIPAEVLWRFERHGPPRIRRHAYRPRMWAEGRGFKHRRLDRIDPPW